MAEEVRRDRYLTQEERTRLLEIARTGIEMRLRMLPIYPPQCDTGSLTAKRGVFVSLHKNGHLRGCIGCIESNQPLSMTVHEMACAAAFDDPRFPPLDSDELSGLDIEVSVLSPLQEVRHEDEIEVGVHGLYIVNGYYRGLLLPQVAVEHKWDRETFLEATCHKAGLPSNAWRTQGTKIFIFTADIFSS